MLGLVLSIFAALLFGLSTVIQKYCLRGMPKFSFNGIIRNKVWILSLFVGFIGIIFYLAALRFAEISIVQPMLSVSIAVPVLVGWFGFRERIGSRWVHILLIIAGVVMISL
jgi:uncharacterized membrane protein